MEEEEESRNQATHTANERACVNIMEEEKRIRHLATILQTNFIMQILWKKKN